MKTSAKVFSFLTALLLCSSLCVSCGKAPDKTDDTSGIEIQNDQFPDHPSFEGETFTILAGKDFATDISYENELTADESTNDPVSKAVHERNSAIEEKYGIKFEIKTHPSSDVYAFYDSFKNSILSANQAYDLIVGSKSSMNDRVLTDLFINLYDLPYIAESLDEDYFYSDAANELTINEKLFYLIGDYNMSVLDNTYVLYYNKTVADQNDIENLYELVLNGEWTIDKALDISRGVCESSKDVTDSSYDVYGYLIDRESDLNVFNAQFDVRYTSRDQDGLPIFDTDREKIHAIIEKMGKYIQNELPYHWGDSIESSYVGDFKNGRSLFLTETLGYADDWQKEGVDFGILPLPKWDGAQNDYYTLTDSEYSIAVVPLDVKDADMAECIIAELYRYSNEYVTCAFTDAAVTSKNGVFDKDSDKVLEIIKNGIQFNTEQFYNSDFKAAYVMLPIIAGLRQNFDADFDALTKNDGRTLTKLITSYEDKAE